MKRITVENIMSWKPCPGYTPERVFELVGNGATLLELLQLPISVKDRLWVAMQYLKRHDYTLLEAWAGDIVERRVRRHTLRCGGKQVEMWAQAWLDGESWAHDQNNIWALRFGAKRAFT